FIITTAGMGDVVDAAAQRPPVPGIDDVEGQGRVDRNGGGQAGGRLPALEADARNRLPRAAGHRHRQRPAVASHDMAALDQTPRPSLRTFHPRIEKTARY